MFLSTHAAGISGSNISSLVASQCPEDCTFKGIKDTFQKQASKVDLDGIFIFYFTGHGMKIGRDQWGLAPVDFDYTKEKLITGTHLADWLHHVRFQGSSAVFILDCCYAGGMADELTKAVVTEDIPIPNLFVITSCSANESSLVISSLGHSIFNFFLTSIMFNSPLAQHGRLPLRDIFEECYQLCAALSSLLISYKPDGTLKWGTMQPSLKYFELTAYVNSLFASDEMEAVDSAGPHRFQFVLSYYNLSFKPSKYPIHDKCHAWLETVAHPEGPLSVLKSHNFLADKVLSAALYAMLYSVASILVACGQSHVADPNLFIILFIHVCAYIDRIHTEFTPSLADLRIGIEYYYDTLRKNKIKSHALLSLYGKVVNDEATLQMSESTDSGEMTTVRK